MKTTTFLLVSAIALSGCGGAPPRVIPAMTAADIEADCSTLLTSAEAANIDLQETYVKLRQRGSHNAAMTTAGILLFPPLLLALDTKGSQENEIGQLNARYASLKVLAERTGCPPLPERHTNPAYDPDRIVDHTETAGGSSIETFPNATGNNPEPTTDADWLTNSAGIASDERF